LNTVWNTTCRGAIVVLTITVASHALAAAGEDPFPSMTAPFYPLVTSGQPSATIVTAPASGEIEKFAAEEIATFVQRISEAELPVVQEHGSEAFPIYIGAAARAKLPDFDWVTLGEEGFLLRCDANGAYVAGNQELGTLYGVYTLLERLGVRFYMPGEFGEVVPSRSDLRLGTMEESQVPAFRYRWIDRGAWALQNKMNIGIEVDGKPAGPQWQWSFHTHFYLVSPDVYFDAHPEWFALVKGKRRRRQREGQQGYQLCTTNPELIEQLSNNVIAYFGEHPDVDILSLAPQDGGGFCTCTPCRALDEVRPEGEAWHARYSNRLAVFNNEVARRVAKIHPEKIIKVGAYALYLRAPQDPDYRPEPNLAVQVCHTYSCNNHSIASDCFRQKKYFRGELEHWARITDHLFIYEYYNKGMWGSMPYDQVHVIREDLPYYKRIGVEGFYTQKAGKKWPACGLNHYVAAKLAWDVELDVDLLLADYYANFFGEAAAPMGRYYEGLMAAFVDYGDCISPYGYKWPTFAAPEIYTPEVMATLGNAVNEALATTADDTVRARIRPYEAQLGYLQRVLDYLKAVRAPFEGIDLNDHVALKTAHKKAQDIGAPLSRRTKAYCKANGIRPFPRIDAAHTDLRFLVTLPGQEPLLR
jgi:hypothetical protein